MNTEANTLIEKNPWLVREINRPYCCGIVSLHHADAREEVGPEFVEYFSTNPYGETDKYVWETRKVDQVINLKIFIKK